MNKKRKKHKYQPTHGSKRPLTRPNVVLVEFMRPNKNDSLHRHLLVDTKLIGSIRDERKITKITGLDLLLFWRWTHPCSSDWSRQSILPSHRSRSSKHNPSPKQRKWFGGQGDAKQMEYGM